MKNYYFNWNHVLEKLNGTELRRAYVASHIMRFEPRRKKFLEVIGKEI
ncbi:hypothetical protein VP01_3272g2 [Puccinia sorghi]|uniref:Uncharacterized protein n=1 Tax=Puccinia sorghi TaxID=27349 RepID=A0A0L6UZS5_9BASI|nr:hypothetical protein VP01_3272g2 [Puccinia sorghi]